jgi:hypothetical protein
MRLRSLLWRSIQRVDLIISVAVVVAGIAATLEIATEWYSQQQAIYALMALLALHVVYDRHRILRPMKATLDGVSRGDVAHFIARNDQRFTSFAEFCRGADEVVVIGIDLGYVCRFNSDFLRDRLRAGTDFKLLLIPPLREDQPFVRLIDGHDERNPPAGRPPQSHNDISLQSLRILRDIAEGPTKGTLEVRLRTDLPTVNLTMVDPRTMRGRMRLELKIYRMVNSGAHMIELGRDSVMYDILYDRYYTELWAQSQPVDLTLPDSWAYNI